MHVKDCRLTGRPATAWYMSADGKHLGGKLLRSDSGPGAGTRNEDALFDVPTAEGRKCIAFSPLQLIDDDELLNQAQHAQIGELKIQIRLVELIGATTPAMHAPVVMNTTTVHERSKKGMIYNVQFGSSSSAPTPQNQDVKHIGPPLVEFVFRYRPLDILQANGIASPPTPKVALPSPRISPARSRSHEVEIKPHLESVRQTDEEIRQLESKLACLKRKREGQESATVKQEPGSLSKRPRVRLSDEVIDLTLDDD